MLWKSSKCYLQYTAEAGGTFDYRGQFFPLLMPLLFPVQNTEPYSHSFVKLWKQQQTTKTDFFFFFISRAPEGVLYKQAPLVVLQERTNGQAEWGWRGRRDITGSSWRELQHLDTESRLTAEGKIPLGELCGEAKGTSQSLMGPVGSLQGQQQNLLGQFSGTKCPALCREEIR